VTHVLSSHFKSLYWVMSSYSAKFADSCPCLPPKKVCGGDKVVPRNFASRTFVSQIGNELPAQGLLVESRGGVVGLFPFTQALDDRYQNDLFIASTDAGSFRFGSIFINRAGRYKIQVDVGLFYEQDAGLNESRTKLFVVRDGLIDPILIGAKIFPFLTGQMAYVDMNAVYDLQVGDLVQLQVESVASDPGPPSFIRAHDMSAISVVQVGDI